MSNSTLSKICGVLVILWRKQVCVFGGSIENIPHWWILLNSWSPPGGTIWEDFRGWLGWGKNFTDSWCHLSYIVIPTWRKLAAWRCSHSCLGSKLGPGESGKLSLWACYRLWLSTGWERARKSHCYGTGTEDFELVRFSSLWHNTWQTPQKERLLSWWCLMF